MLITDITRKQAFLTHLTVSGLIFLILAYLIVYHWYPDFYFSLDGGDRAILTIFFVDVVLGPGLTLLVFKQGKKSLKFDMSVIVLLQVSALIWGVHSVYNGRPATTVFHQVKFTCISNPDATMINMDLIRQGPSKSQNLAFLQRPDYIDDLLDFAKEAFAHESSPVFYYSEQIRPLDHDVVHRLNLYSLDMNALEEENPTYATLVATYLSNLDNSDGSYKLIPVNCRYKNKIAVYDIEQLRIVDMLDVPTNLSAKALDEPLPLKPQAAQSMVNNLINETMEDAVGNK